MTSGCVPGGVAATDWAGPVVVDTAPLRCPPADPRARAEFRRVVAAPSAREIAAARAAGQLDGLTRAKIDELRAALLRKNAAGRRALDEQDKCRSGIGAADSRPAKAPDDRSASVGAAGSRRAKARGDRSADVAVNKPVA